MKSNALRKQFIVDEPPEWFPEKLQKKEMEFHSLFRFSEAERKVYRKRKKILPSDWAERHRYITRGPLEGSRFRKDTLAYSAGVMDASFYPSVQEVVMCFADQTGKSFIIDTCNGYVADRAPGPFLYVYPDEDTAKENMKDRILPMYRMSPRLKSYFTGTMDDETQKGINLQHMQVYMAWARSAPKLANKSIRYLANDEVDKYPATVGKREGSPLDKAEKRLRAYRYGSKCWKSSTPTIEMGPIWQELLTCQVVFDFWVCCPDCGELQLMKFEQIKWPENERDPEKIKYGELAWYECCKCGSKWSDLKRDAAVRWGEWRARHAEWNKNENERSSEEDPGDPTSPAAAHGQEGLELFEYLRKFEPKKIGFHLPAWVSYVVSLSECAWAFLRGLKDKTAFKDFKNSYEAVPWLDYTAERKEDVIVALKDDRPRGLVPGSNQVACLTAGVDTQDDGFYFEIRAWGWGMDLESWQVREGFVQTFEGLKQILWDDEYRDADNNKHFVRLVVQDAMGHKTSEVYDFARMHRRKLYPFQGVQRLSRPFDFSHLDVYPGKKKKIPGGLILLRADVTYFKNALAQKLEINAADPGAWHMHNEMTYSWAQQMCAEYVDDKTGFWLCPANKANHAWDVSVYALIAAHVLGVKFWKKRPPGEKRGKLKTEEEKRAKKIPKTNKGYKRPSWLENR
ncbi:terminase gpA endonuclease subunit [Thermodesulfobacteriota bacterium]